MYDTYAGVSVYFALCACFCFSGIDKANTVGTKFPLFSGDGGQQKRLRLSHQRPSPSDHHPLHQADPGHQTVDHGLHESGAVRLSVGG